MSLETHTPGSGTGHSQTPVNSLMMMSNARSAEASAHIELNILEVFFRTHTHTHTAAWSVAQLVLLFQTSCLLNFLESGTSVCALPPNPLSLSLLCRLPTHSLYFHY